METLRRVWIAEGERGGGEGLSYDMFVWILAKIVDQIASFTLLLE